MSLSYKNLCLIGLLLFGVGSRVSLRAGDSPIIEPRVGAQHDYELLLSMGPGILHRMGFKNDADCADIIQQAATRLLLSPAGYTGLGNYRGFLARVLRNAALNSIRRSKSGIALSIDVPHRDVAADELVQNREFTALVWRRITSAVSKQSPTNRMPYLMVMEGFTYEEISAALKIDIGTVKSGMNRVTRHLDASLRGLRGPSGDSGHYPATLLGEEAIAQIVYSPLGAEPSHAVQAIGLLDTEERRMLIWYAEFSTSPDEIAAMLGLSTEQVQQTLRRAQANLMALWEKYRLSPENRFLVDPS